MVDVSTGGGLEVNPCIISVFNEQKWINVHKDSKTKSINSNYRRCVQLVNLGSNHIKHE